MDKRGIIFTQLSTETFVSCYFADDFTNYFAASFSNGAIISFFFAIKNLDDKVDYDNTLGK